MMETRELGNREHYSQWSNIDIEYRILRFDQVHFKLIWRGGRKFNQNLRTETLLSLK